MASISFIFAGFYFMPAYNKKAPENQRLKIKKQRLPVDCCAIKGII
jgi:hypothetical protein